ncbi:hypothetical protein [Bacillus sp. UMB0728]|uniref:hypothetical protein n=1 Tax=Bacillus sp. UMB0728 TaxID=2066052 RepID=UPI000C759F3E|nr:hypothetical protein [Bacillus sp. UMB0728]PLR72239.1 hypothetical protein CYJ37_11835 [Bacillus sp. UMB0728]
MDVLFDMKLTSGEVITGVYFLQYQRPVKSGRGSILIWANDCIRAFDSADKEIKGRDFEEAELIKAYDKDNGTDITDYFKQFAKDVSNFQVRPMTDRNIFAREVLKVDS